PNPATAAVTVASSYSITRIEAYDLGGGKMLDMKAAGLSAKFSVDSWPSGTYVVVIHTPNGTATKKLVVK
ncbi:MAG: T9SS type A sorting domain-containing protein, partial [Bacteroidales bacterium]|nr:T9SS type A sorting domain-containing protein [Bacteroidales bacterium]